MNKLKFKDWVTIFYIVSLLPLFILVLAVNNFVSTLSFVGYIISGLIYINTGR